MNHKMSSVSLVNSINYMSVGFSGFPEHDFVGWLEVTGHYTWGIDIGGVPHVAVHIFRTQEGFSWGDDEEDTLEYAASHPYIMMFYGIDNSSCFKRFKTKEDAMAEWHERKSIEWNELGVLSYNS